MVFCPVPIENKVDTGYNTSFFWFSLFRCREKQKKESGDVAAENRRLHEANKLLKEENDGLNQKLIITISENGELRHQVFNVCYFYLLKTSFKSAFVGPKFKYMTTHNKLVIFLIQYSAYTYVISFCIESCPF